MDSQWWFHWSILERLVEQPRWISLAKRAIVDEGEGEGDSRSIDSLVFFKCKANKKANSLPLSPDEDLGTILRSVTRVIVTL
jgi:hypothetical protein